MYLKLGLLPLVSDLTYFPDNEAHKIILAYNIFQNTMFTNNQVIQLSDLKMNPRIIAKSCFLVKHPK